MLRKFILIWISSIVLACASIFSLLALFDEAAYRYPDGLPALENPEVVFIGSSLTRHALPRSIEGMGVIEDGRSCSMLTIPDISEELSTRLLAHAVEAKAETIFLEINAYAHEYIEYMDWNEPVLVRSIAENMRQVGHQLTIIVKSYFGFGNEFSAKDDSECGAPPSRQLLDVARLVPSDYYRFNKIVPAYPKELKIWLLHARERGIKVIFFSPPRPQALVSVLGAQEFSDLHGHLLAISRAFDLPLWYPAEPWSDEYFMDILAHLNSDGRERLKRELAQWYEARR